jgi:hypothetical protein
MNKKIVSTLVGLILLMTMAAPLQADSAITHKMKVVVPFAFSAGEQLMPAGEYTVEVNTENGTVVLHPEGQNSVVLITNSKESMSSPDRPRLVFQRYGANYFLAEVWNQDNSIGHTLQQSDREKELSRNGQLEQTLAVQAR